MKNKVKKTIYKRIIFFFKVFQNTIEHVLHQQNFQTKLSHKAKLFSTHDLKESFIYSKKKKAFKNKIYKLNGQKINSCIIIIIIVTT